MISSEQSEYSRLRVSLLNFGFFHAFGYAIPYFTLYLSRTLVFPDGRTANHLIGLLLFVFNILVLLSSPIAGYVSDRFRIGSRVLSICSVGVAVGAALIATPGFLNDLSFGATVALTLSGVVIAGFFLHPIIPLIDTQTLSYLHYSHGHASEYGRIRMLGSIGFTISTILIAVILSQTGTVGWTFALFAAGFVGVAIISESGVRVRAERIRIPWHHLKGNRRFQLFLLFAFSVSLSMNSAFLFTGYFLDEIQAGFMIMGLTFAASVVPEIPIMFHSGKLIRRLGPANLILFGTGLQVAKLVLFVVFASSTTTSVFALISVLHGLGFASLYTGCVSFVDDAAHPAMRATYQSLFHLLWVVAVAVGGPVSGVIIEQWNTTVLMATYAGMLILTLLYFVLFVAPTSAAVLPRAEHGGGSADRADHDLRLHEGQ